MSINKDRSEDEDILKQFLDFLLKRYDLARMDWVWDGEAEYEDLCSVTLDEQDKVALVKEFLNGQ